VVQRVPQKYGQSPIWLCISKESSGEFGLHYWEGRTESSNATRVLIRSDERNQLEVTSEGGNMKLIMYNSHVGFVTEKTLKSLEKTTTIGSTLCKRFILRTEYNEGIKEIQSSTADSKYLKFEWNNSARQDGLQGKIVCSSTPSDSKIHQIDLVYHTLLYSFLIEHQLQRRYPENTEQYMSLNFYYNTMRNKKTEHQLIRADDFF